MTIDPKWLDVLKLPLKVTIAIAFASLILLAFDLRGVLDLGPIGAFTRPVLIILSVVFSILAVVGIVDYLMAPFHEKRRQSAIATRRAIRREEKEEQLEANRAEVVARLDHLSKEEIHYVAESLREGSPTFYTYIHSPPVSMLQGKGLAWTPGGSHHRDHYPFTFFDFVWKELVGRRDEFLAKDEENKRAVEAEKAEKAAQWHRRGY